MKRQVVEMRTFATAHPFVREPDTPVVTMSGVKAARDVIKGDFLLLASEQRPVFDAAAISALLPQEPAPRRSQDDKTRLSGARLPVTKQQLQKHIADGLTYQEIATRYGRVSKTSAHRWAIFYGLNKPGGQTINSDCVHDSDFWRVVGMWIAEGSLTQGRTGGPKRVVRWSFSWDEEHTLAEFVVRTLARHGLHANKRKALNYGGPHCFPTERDWSVTLVSTSSIQLAELLRTAFGAGAHHKRLPAWAHRLPYEHAIALVRGWTDGDGYFWPQNGGYRVASTSYELMYGVQRLLARHQMTSQVMRNRADAGELRWDVPAKPYSTHCDEQGLWVRVKSSELTVEDDQRDLLKSGGDGYSVDYLLAAARDLDEAA